MNVTPKLALCLALIVTGCGSPTDDSTTSGFLSRDKKPSDGDLKAVALSDPNASSNVPVSLEGELAEIRQKLVTKYDTNKDGKLDEAETEAAIKAEAKKAKTRFDTNGDGKLSEEELKNFDKVAQSYWKDYKQKNPEDAKKIEDQACKGVESLYANLQANGYDPSKNKYLARAMTKCTVK